MCHGPRKDTACTPWQGKDTSGSLMWDVDTHSYIVLFGLANLYWERMKRFQQLHRKAFVSGHVGKWCVLRSPTSVHRPTLVTSFQTPHGVLVLGDTEDLGILYMLTGLKTNLMSTAIYDEDNDNLPGFFPTAN